MSTSRAGWSPGGHRGETFLSRMPRHGPSRSCDWVAWRAAEYAEGADEAWGCNGEKGAAGRLSYVACRGRIRWHGRLAKTVGMWPAWQSYFPHYRQNNLDRTAADTA